MSAEMPTKLTYEEERASELERQARDRKEMLEGQREGKEDFAERAKAKDMDPIELGEKLKAIEAVHNKALQQLQLEQQRRLDEIDLRHLGPPSERDKGRER